LNIIDNMDATGNLGLIHRIDLSRIYPSIHPSRIFWGNFPGYPGGNPGWLLATIATASSPSWLPLATSKSA
jgi:hypothetical protein